MWNNYSNTYSINYNTYPSPFRGSSGTYNEEFLIATYNVLAGNKIKLNYFCKYGTWFYGNNQNSFDGYYTFKITTFYIKVYKNSSLINTYSYNLNGTYSNTILA